MQFFFLEDSFNFLGGNAVYYMGTYGYGSSASKHDERAHRLARLDAFEQLGLMLGSLLAPMIFSAGGFYTISGIAAACDIIAFFYLVFCVKEVIVPKKDEKQKGLSKIKLAWTTFARYLITPIIEMVKALIKKRPKNLKFLLYLQLFVYGMFWFVLEENSLLYSYALAVLPDFDGTDWAYMMVMSRGLTSIGLLVVMPILVGKFKLHETVILIFIAILNVVHSTLLAYITKTWQLWVCQAIGNRGR